MELSKKTAALIIIIALCFSIGGMLLSLNKLNSIEGITGRASTEYAGVNVTITSTASINFTVNNVNFGTGTVSSGCSFCMLNTSGVTDACCVGFTTPTPTGLVIENTGNKNVSLNLSFDMDAETYIGGTGPLFQINATENETYSCVNNTYGPASGLNTTYNDTFGSVISAATGIPLCSNFRTEQLNDEIRINIRLKIPENSRTGARNATIIASAANMG